MPKEKVFFGFIFFTFSTKNRCHHFYNLDNTIIFFPNKQINFWKCGKLFFIFVAMVTNTVIISVQEQIKAALDGRTQRWLQNKVGIISEDMLSKKMQGHFQFTKEEIDAINKVLKSKIKLT